MTESEYRSKPGISRSELWKLMESPEKFKYYQEHPVPMTPAFIFGAAAHKQMLDPETWGDEFAVSPIIDRRTKDGKAQYADWLDQVVGREIISKDEYDTITQMVSVARGIPFVTKLLAGEKETPLFWTDDLTGEPCKARLDCVTMIADKPVIVDYKTTNDASTDGFMRSAIKYGYTFQAGMYLEGFCQTTYHKSILSLLGSEQCPLFVFIVQEKTPPYSVNICQADDVFIRYGYDIFRQLIGMYKDCKDNDNFFGYMGKYNIINNLSIPAYLAKEAE